MAAPSDPLRSLAADARSAHPRILQGIREASRKTGIDFGFLVAQARQESGFRADATSAMSSATGLYQFVDRTWLDMVRRHGAKHGLADAAQAIATDSGGRPSVSDPAQRQRILDLRKDPAISAALAGEYANDNKGEIERALGRKATGTDLSLAHFLGAGGATELLRQVQSNAAAPAADLFPEAAAANRSIFYDRGTGAPRSVKAIYDSFAAKLAPAAGARVAENPLATGSGGDKNSGFRLPGMRGAGLLSQPVSAMLNSIALSAMKLLGGDGNLKDRRTPPA